MTRYSPSTTPYEPEPLSTHQLIALQRLLQDFALEAKENAYTDQARYHLLKVVSAKLEGKGHVVSQEQS